MNENFNGRDFVFLPKQHRSEVYCADRIHMMLRYPPESITGIDREIAEIERTEGIEYAELQKDAIRAALEKGLLILTGGPGTGKTTTLNAIIRILMEKGETVFLGGADGARGEAYVRADGRGGEDHSPHVTGGLGRQR